MKPNQNSIRYFPASERCVGVDYKAPSRTPAQRQYFWEGSRYARRPCEIVKRAAEPLKGRPVHPQHMLVHR